MKALAHGVPMVCIPMGRDQNDTAARVVHHGAGVRLPPKASTERIAAAVRQVLDDPSYRDNARRMASVIAAEAATIDVVAELEADRRQRRRHRLIHRSVCCGWPPHQTLRCNEALGWGQALSQSERISARCSSWRGAGPRTPASPLEKRYGVRMIV